MNKLLTYWRRCHRVGVWKTFTY